jgi:CelD/BcsL family acetyltransferase involved in cellulose biosynthesis
MSVHKLDPLHDPRWPEFLKRHPKASIFHTAGWLESLRRSYGYEAFVLTTTPPGRDLENGIPFCRIKSWLTGERIVSIPFADHCEPLFDRAEDFHAVLEAARGNSPGWRQQYTEIRPLSDVGSSLAGDTSFSQGSTFRLHLLDLSKSQEELFRSFDKSSVQRGIKKAEKLALTYDEGTSEELLRKFYALQVVTRRRHQLPPQPLQWFQNLLENLRQQACIRVILHEGRPIASIFTFFYNGTMLYKYGCSDPKFNNLRGTTLLFWKTIQAAKQLDAKVFDLGRSDLDNPGLIRFKSEWGSRELPLIYWRYPQPKPVSLPVLSKTKRAGRQLLSHLPDNILILLGKTLYKHAG